MNQPWPYLLLDVTFIDGQKKTSSTQWLVPIDTHAEPMFVCWSTCLGHPGIFQVGPRLLFSAWFPLFTDWEWQSDTLESVDLQANICLPPHFFQGFLNFSRQQSLLNKVSASYLPGTGVNHDHEGGSPRVRLFHCTEDELTSTITPNVGNSSASFLLVGDCVRAIPCSSHSVGQTLLEMLWVGACGYSKLWAGKGLVV